MLLNCSTGIRHFDLGQLLSRIENKFFAQIIDEHGTEFLILLHIDGAIALVARQYTYLAHGLVYLVVDILVVIRMTGESKT